MKPTRLIVAAVLMAALGGVWVWSNKQEKAKEGQPPADESPKILTIKDTDVRKVEITHRDGETTVVAKNDSGTWAITAPKPLAADQNAVTALTGNANPLRSERVLDDSSPDLASYGLAPPLLTVKFTTADGKNPTLLIGEATATGSSAYAKVEGDPRLFVMAASGKTAFDKSSKDLRDKRLMTFDKDKTSRVELDVAKQPPIEFGRISESEWQILKPKPMRADGFQVEDLITKVHEAEMNPSLSDEDVKKYASAFASGPQVAVVSATDPSGTQKLEVHKSGEDYYAKSSVVEGINKLSADVGKLFDKKVDDFRNKKVFDFGFNDPTHVEIKDGPKMAAYDKSGENWTSNGKTMDSVSVQAVIDKLRDLSATKFVDTGFTTPVIELTVASSGGKRVEKVKIAPAGKDFLAQREGEPTLYQLDAGVVDELRRAANDIKEPPPPEKKK
jgi:hypothetical protein